MKKRDLPVVHCTYCNTEKSISEILEESFRLYLGRILAAMEHPLYNVSDEWPLISGGMVCT